MNNQVENMNQFNYDLATTAKHIFDAHSRTFLCYFDFNEMNRIINQALPNSPSSSSSSSSSSNNNEVQRIINMVSGYCIHTTPLCEDI